MSKMPSLQEQIEHMREEAEAERDGLSAAHRKILCEKSAISEEAIKARGYKTIIDVKEFAALGFEKKQWSGPGLLLPVCPVNEKIKPKLYVYRPDKTRGKMKYIFPGGCRMQLDSPPSCQHLLLNPKIPLRITEGQKKGDSLISNGAQCVIALLGVTCWRGTNEDGGKSALADWNYVVLNGRKVTLDFDSDAATNPKVKTALRKFTKFLESQLARVYHTVLPPRDDGSKQGVDDYFADGGTLGGMNALRKAPASNKPKPIENGDLHSLDDMGNSERLVEQFHNTLKFTPQRGWFLWDGVRWMAEPSKKDAVAIECSKSVVRRMQDDALKYKENGEEETFEQLSAWAAISRSARKISDMVHLSKSDPLMSANQDDFDPDSLLFNCANGIIDLRTGKLLPHSPDKLQSCLSSVIHDSKTTCPLWLKFLERIIKDEERILFLQRAVGYSLTASSAAQVFFLLHGAGANGKTVFLELVKYLMGDYAQSSRFETFTVKNNNSSNDIARLHISRGVFVSEIAEYQRLNESLIKDIVGGDTISARFLYHESFDFVPHCKIWIRGNHRPIIRDMSHGMWRRVVLVEFNESIPEEERDPDLLDKLKREASGILNWAIEGCLNWQKNGLVIPQSVKEDVSEYKNYEDTIGRFLDDCTESAPIEHRVYVKDLYPLYQAWCQETGNKFQLDIAAFGRKLTDKVPERIPKKDKKAHSGAAYYGIALKNRF